MTTARAVPLQAAGGILVLGMILAGVMAAQQRSFVPEEAPPPRSPFQFEHASVWQGSASCASTACHNANGPRGSKRSEYATWSTVDPHHRAYAALHDDRSARITANLKRGKPAWNDSLCLNCHVHPAKGPDQAEAQLLARAEGVGCESCHGSAQGWRTVHYLADWPQKSDAEKLALGMFPTKDLAARAKICAGCHVGEGSRDVNHDLIAAGHPRMNFEFGAFHAVLPKHWDEQAEKARHPDFEARAWAIGQVVSAQTALELLAARAKDESKPWPEFSEYNCFACHHDLLGQSWRQERTKPAEGGKSGKGLGQPPWETWYFAMLPQALATTGSGPAKEVPGLRQIKDAMENSKPVRTNVGRDAQTAANLLTPWISKSDQVPPESWGSIHERLKAVAEKAREVAAHDWDGAAQVYLALAALYHAEGDIAPAQRNPQLREYLRTMREELEFYPDRDVKYGSPEESKYSSREKRFREALDALREQLLR
jgi:hypothetical protein